MTGFAIDRVAASRRMPGVVVVPRNLSIGAVISDILLIALVLEPSEIENQIWYLPL